MIRGMVVPTFEDEAYWLWLDYLAGTNDPEPHDLESFTEANRPLIEETMMENYS